MNNANEEKKSLREDLGKRETVDNARVGRNIVWSVVGLGVFAAGYFAYNYITKPEDIQVVEQTQRPIVYPGPDTNIVRTIRPKIASEDTTGGYVRLPSKDYGRLQKNSQRAEELEREKDQLTERLSTANTQADTLNQRLRKLYDQAPVHMKEFAYEFSQLGQTPKDGYGWKRTKLDAGLSLDQRLLAVQRNYNEKAELGRTIPGFDDKKELFDYETLMFVPTSNPRTIGVSSKDKFGTEKYSEYYVGVQEK